MKKITVGLLGFGTVGAGVADILINRKEVLKQNTGFDIELKYIVDKNPDIDRGVSVPRGIIVSDPQILLDDEEVDIVVELIGGCDFAREFILRAASRKKHIVTANKALLASHWEELVACAKNNDVDLMFEASVAGGIPIIKAIRESFVGNKLQEIRGIINGTSNYILTQMRDQKEDLRVALKKAQKLGYAEADPTFDIEGIDTAHKLSILTALAFGTRVKTEEMHIEGISKITLNDILYADQLGYSIKLLAIAKVVDNFVDARVHPTLLRKDNLLSSINDVFNGVYVKGDAVGGTIFYGRGAGRYPTASAVVADIADLAKKIGTGFRNSSYGVDLGRKPLDFDSVVCRYYIRFAAADKPGVLGAITAVLGENNISISSVMQQEGKEDNFVPVVIMTHKAREHDMQNALRKIKKLALINKDIMLIRVED